MKLLPSWTRDDILLKIASLIIAILLWLQIQSRVDVSTQREYSVPLDIRNLAKDYVITRAPSHVTVIAEGSKQDLQELDPDRLETFINLRKAKIGQNEYPVQLNLLRKLNIKLSLKYPAEIVHIEKLAQKSSIVTLEERGLPPSDLIYDGSEISPRRVVLVGPESLVAKSAKARVMFNLSQATPGGSCPALVEVLGRNNQPIRSVRAEPSVVMITPLITAAPAGKRLLINPTWKGSPAFGFKVKNYLLYPNQVEVKGHSSQLAHLTALDTEPIIIDNLRANKTFSVNLKVPNQVQITGKSEIRVTIQIVPNETL